MNSFWRRPQPIWRISFLLHDWVNFLATLRALLTWTINVTIKDTVQNFESVNLQINLIFLIFLIVLKVRDIQFIFKFSWILLDFLQSLGQIILELPLN